MALPIAAAIAIAVAQAAKQIGGQFMAQQSALSNQRRQQAFNAVTGLKASPLLQQNAPQTTQTGQSPVIAQGLASQANTPQIGGPQQQPNLANPNLMAALQSLGQQQQPGGQIAGAQKQQQGPDPNQINALIAQLMQGRR